jgi:hypothetical protein
VLFDHSPFYGGSLLRAVAGGAATAMLSRFVSTCSGYFDAIRPMFRFTIRDMLWLMVVVALACGWWIEHQRVASLWHRFSEVEAKRSELQDVFDAMKERAAKAKMDDDFRRAYDGPRNMSPPPYR